MDIDAPIVLAPGTRLIRSEELRQEDRERAGCRPDDVVITRSGVRARSKLLPPEGRRIVEFFRSPCRIVDAVRSLARDSGEAPDAVLERTFPLLKLLINDGLLIDAEAAKDEPEPPLPRASLIGLTCPRTFIQRQLESGPSEGTDG